MSGFAVFRHPDVTVAGVLPSEAADTQRARGWYRVSHWAPSSDFDLPSFTADLPDLDAPEPEPEPEPESKPVGKADAKKTKE